MRLMKLTLALAVLVIASQAALAQFSVQKFAPSPYAQDYLTVSGSESNGHLKPNVGLFFNYAARPLAFVRETGNKVTQEVVKGLVQLDALFSFSLWKRLEIGVDVPIDMVSGKSGASVVSVGDISSFTLGDLRFGVKGTILDHQRKGFGLGLDLGVTVPTAKNDSFVAEKSATFVPRLIAELNIDDYRVALNAGYRMRENSQLGFLAINDELLLGLATSIPVYQKNLFVIGELQSATDISDFYAERNTRYLEGDAAVKYLTDGGLGFTLGGGAGFLKGVGNPKYRLFASVGWFPRADSPADQDHDGIVDGKDLCPLDPEDIDGYRDEEGCPDPDNDADNIPDVSDKCPDKAEDIDQFADADGCPDPDNDNDGIADARDACPNEAEDIDGFQDVDGCPDPDNDKDGVLDTNDKCPLEPETVNEYEDQDGCPDTPPAVFITKEKIVIMQKVFFQKGTDVVLKKSYDILEQVSAILKDHPEITKVSVEGHTSSEGKAANNKKLSEKRAAAIVKFMTKKGIDKSRLQSAGWGSEKPLAPLPEADEAARETNRRVEFLILERQ
jgi:outer membrane protein OmpA-like peptidoglycan-associated protein